MGTHVYNSQSSSALTPQATHPNESESGHDSIHTCIHCQKLLIDARKIPSSIADPGEFWDMQIQIVRTQFQSALKDGCSLFRHMHRQLKPRGIQSDSSNDDRSIPLEMNLFLRDLVGEMQVWLRGSEHSAKVTAFASRNSSAATEIENRQPQRVVLNDHTVRDIKEWLSECSSNHDCLPILEASKSPPSRLIRISLSGDRIRLCLAETHSVPIQTLKWCALSYCWGEDQACKTTLENYQDRLKNLDYDSLPKTIQDAVRAAHLFDIEFLWVDSLCIIQNSASDLASQLGRMHDIYKYAWVTFAASRAKICSEGFLHDRPFRPVVGEPSFGQLPYICKDGTNSTVMLSFITYNIPNTSSEPLQSRAWTLQETYLSTRLVEFASKQSHWRCTVTTGYDGFYSQFLYQADWAQYHEEQGPDWFNQAWGNLIYEYSGRNLTYLGDKFPAVSAIAEGFAEQSKYSMGNYIAGLWEKTLLTDLLWYHGDPETPIEATNKQYIAPSWSWASVEGTVFMWIRANAANNMDIEVGDLLVPAAEICSYKVEKLYGNVPFGPVKSGVITIKGMLKTAIWRLGQSQSTLHSDDGPNAICIADAVEDAREERQIHESTLVIKEVYCLQILYWSKGYVGLLLEPRYAVGSAEYKRIDMFVNRGTYSTPELKEFWRTADRITIDLI